MKFEWDQDKAKSNVRKHSVEFADAALVFLDPHRKADAHERKQYRDV
jgi:uncharacterized DUF497 family protein